MIFDILLVKSNNFIGRQIRKITNSNYNHVGLFIEDDKIIEATLWSGVVITDFKNFKKAKRKNKIDFEIYRLKNSLTCNEENRIKNYLLDKVGKKYDIMQFLSLFFFFLFNINRKINPIDIEKHFICSELIGKAFDKVNILFNNEIELDNLTPKDIENSNIIEMI